MQLTTATPVEIDTKLAELDYAARELEARVASAMSSVRSALGHKGIKRGRGASAYTEWPCTNDEAVAELRAKGETYMGMGRYAHEVVAKYDARVAELDANLAEQAPLHAEFTRRKGWTRFYAVEGGHLHRSRHCSSCNKGRTLTRFGWMPEMSGRDEAEAIAELAAAAHILCTVCFPGAPVVAKRPAPTAAERAEARAAAERAARINDEKLIATPEGDELRVDGDMIRTVRAAELKAVDALWWAGYSLANRKTDSHVAAYEVHVAPIVAALAAKRGTTEADERAAIVAKATKKIKRELGADVAALAAARWAEQARQAEQAPADLDALRDEALLEQPQQQNAQDMNPEYRVPQHVLDTDRALGQADAATRAEQAAAQGDVDEAPAIDPNGEHTYAPGDGDRCAVPGCNRLSTAMHHRAAAAVVWQAELDAAAAGRRFARWFAGGGVDLPESDLRYRMRVEDLPGHRCEIDLYDEFDLLLGRARLVGHGWAFTWAGDTEALLYSDRFRYLDEMVRQAHARRAAGDDIEGVADEVAPVTAYEQACARADEVDMHPGGLVGLIEAYGNCRASAVAAYRDERAGATPRRPAARYEAEGAELLCRVRDLATRVYAGLLDYGDECAEYGMPGELDPAHATRSNGHQLRRLIREVLGALPAPELAGDDEPVRRADLPDDRPADEFRPL